MPSDPRQWNEVASVKLARIFGDREGAVLHSAILVELGLPHVTSSTDLQQFAAALSRRGKFEAAVGSMLALHATMYGAPEPRAAER